MRVTSYVPALAAVLLPLPAVAAPLPETPVDWVLWSAPLVALLCLPLIFWQQRRLRQLLDEAGRREEEKERLSEILAAAPDGYFLWTLDDSGFVTEEHCSRRLAVLLDLYRGTASTFDDVLEKFQPAEAARLKAASATLNGLGQGFELELTFGEGRRRVLVLGGRAADPEGRPLADVMWTRDVTEGATAVDRLSEETHGLAAERDRLKALLNALPVPVWLRGGDLALLSCNLAYVRAVDAPSPSKATERELVPTSLVREARALAATARAAGISRESSFRLVMEGARRLVEIIETPIAVEDSDGLLTVGVAIDRTRQEEAQTLVERHAAAHAEVLEKLGTAIAIFSADTTLSFFNTAYRQLWGLDAEWLTTKPTYGAVLDALRESRRLPEVADFRAFKEEETRRFTSLLEPGEDLLHLPDERTLRRVISAHPFGGLLFTYEDVTDRLALERSHRTSLAVHRETLDNLYEGIAVFASDGRLRLSNPAYGRIWNLTAESLDGQPHIGDLIDLHHDFFTDASNWPETRERLMALFTLRQTQSGRIKRSDGLILDYASVPLPDGAVLTTWLDVSDTARVEMALRERNEALAAADRLKSEFITGISAEMRTPLTAILGYADLLANEYFGALNPRQKEYAVGIGKTARHLGQVFSDIVDLAAIEAGQMTLSLDSIDVHAMLAGVLALTQERLREKRIAVSFDCPLDIGWMVADERRVRQVLFNLLSNAVKSTPEQGRIILAAKREGSPSGEEIAFVISDPGHDAPSDEREEAFEGFVPDPAPGLGQNGSDLGLALVRNFVELHAGRVEPASTPEGDPVVIVYLPASDS